MGRSALEAVSSTRIIPVPAFATTDWRKHARRLRRVLPLSPDSMLIGKEVLRQLWQHGFRDSDGVAMQTQNIQMLNM
jgi:hypothetical protein